MSAAWLLLFFLPFLLSLVGNAPMPWLLCFVASLLAMLSACSPAPPFCPGGSAW